jgi:c(7)-type cytochrome triheme protein
VAGWVLLIALAAAQGAGQPLGGRAAADGDPSAVYPPHGGSYAFDHAAHAGLEPCQSCHNDVAESDSALQEFWPTMASCGRCHAQVEATEDADACAFCHTGYRPLWPEGDGLLAVRDPRFPLVGPEPYVPLRPNLVFSHTRHAQWPCGDCHPDEVAGGASLPTMEQCLACHTAQAAGADCLTCHPGGQEGRLLTRFEANQRQPELWLLPGDHLTDWTRGHALAAALDAQACLTCHAEQDCLSCHDGSLGTQSPHPAGFLNWHAWDAQGPSAACSSCHVASVFCADCHVDVGVVTDPEHRPPQGFGWHPPDWVAVGGGQHAPAASLDLMTCVGCHAENDCLSCHLLADPHGPEFLARCSSLAQANPELCQACHAAGELPGLTDRCE